jgi:hypothetical protein
MSPRTTQAQAPGFFSGPAFDKYSAERTRAYTESPSRLQYNLDANKAAGQLIQDKTKELLGDNIFSKTIGGLGTLAAVPVAALATPFHEAAQVVKEGRMEPGSGIKGFTEAFLAEKPLLTAAQRAGGVLQSVPFVGDIVEKAGEKTYDLVQGAKDLFSPTTAAAATPTAAIPTKPTMADVAGPTPTIPGFTRLKNPDGAPGNYNEFMYRGPDGQIYGAETYGAISAGRYPNIYDPNKASTNVPGTPIVPRTLASGGIAGQLHMNEGGRTGFAEGTDWKSKIGSFFSNLGWSGMGEEFRRTRERAKARKYIKADLLTEEDEARHLRYMNEMGLPHHAKHGELGMGFLKDLAASWRLANTTRDKEELWKNYKRWLEMENLERANQASDVKRLLKKKDEKKAAGGLAHVLGV